LKRRTHTEAPLQLSSFIPFRLNRLATAISSHLAEIYRERFGLEVAEWRVLVTLGAERACSAQHIVHSTRTHKTRISRAIAQLVKRGLIERVASVKDGRELQLKLSKSGQRVYRQLAPLTLQRERTLLACMSKTQLRSFIAAIKRLEDYLELTPAAEDEVE
jgi:DNA-binding MarR family transcriptional regulator